MVSIRVETPEALRAGAHDCVMKNNLHRLAPAVERELLFAASRRDRRLVQAEFVASEVRYRRLFDSATDGILIVNAGSGTILDANRSLPEQLGLGREQLIGHKIGALPYFHALIPDAAAFAALQAQPSSRCDDRPLFTATGQRLGVELVTSLYLMDQHHLMQCSFRDISARLLATAHLRKLSTIVEQAPLSVVITDLAGTIEYVNLRFCSVTGHTAAKSLGQNPRISVGGETGADGRTARFWVQDHGPGLDAGEQSRTFIPFTRISTARAGSHGLGLSIVRRIVEKLDGEVGVTSSPGTGARFWFELPVTAGRKPVSLHPFP